MGILTTRFNDTDGYEGWWGRQTPLGIFFKVLVVCVALSVLGFVGSFIADWANAGKQIISPANVKAQFQLAYTDYESLTATANNVCQTRARENRAPHGSDAWFQIDAQESAFEQNYTRITAEYNAAYDDAFRAKHVGPRDLPKNAPTLDEMLATVGCTVPWGQ